MAIDVRTIEETKALVRRAIAHNHGVPEEADEIFAPDFVAHLPGRPPLDRQGLGRFIGRIMDGLSDFRYEVDEQIAQDDLVFNRLTGRGVHTADLMGVPASGRPVAIRVINCFKVENGRVVEQWAEPDLFGLLQQIGAIPPA